MRRGTACPMYKTGANFIPRFKRRPFPAPFNATSTLIQTTTVPCSIQRNRPQPWLKSLTPALSRNNKRATSVSAPAERAKRVRLTTDGDDTTDVDTVDGVDDGTEIVVNGTHNDGSTQHVDSTGRVVGSAVPDSPPTAGATTNQSDPTVDIGFADKTAFPDATTEAAAVVLLNSVGAEPGALVGLDLAGLNAVYRSLLHERIAAGLLPTLPRVAAAPALRGRDVPVATVLPAGAPVNAHASLPTTLPEEMSSALEAFSKLGVPADRLTGKDFGQMRRLYSILTYFDHTRCVGTLDRVRVPGEWDWGLSSAFNDASNLLCAKGSSKPLTVWVPGEVTNQYFYDDNGGPAKRVAISVQPLSGRIHDSSKNLLNSLSSPRNTSLVAAAFGPDQFRATRWMTVRGQRGQASSVVEFSDYYDARSALKDKLLMEKIGVNQIMEHDLVLVEARIGRYNSEPASEVKGKKRVMNNWQTFYDLQAIYLIQNASAVPAPVVAGDLMI
ncbi:hypothetical protein B0H14DRAFT_3861564 [Mycena olivaceomarginata]|nr:hypothetical protein B0H14DRAFT_3861564 [Mycena olivaceomarginata]